MSSALQRVPMSDAADVMAGARPVGANLRSRRRSPNQLVSNGARAWASSHATLRTVLAVPAVIAALGVVAALIGKPAFKWVTEEDMAAEWLQVVCYAVAWTLCWVLARAHGKAGRSLIATLYVFLACGLFFLIGEEVSWGQRMFGWLTPESLAAINGQDETTLHNIRGVQRVFVFAQMLVGGYGTILPLIFMRLVPPQPLRALVKSVVPHWSLIPYFLPMFVWKVGRYAFGTPDRMYYVMTNYNEVIELILALGFTLFMVLQFRTWCRPRPDTSLP